MALFVGLMCGLTPACVQPEIASPAKRSINEETKGSVRQERGRRADEAKPWEELRLPPAITPEFYNLTVQPDLTGSDTFQGWASILINVSEPIEYPRIHIKNINVTLSKIIDDTGSELVEVNPAFYYEYNEFYVMDVGTLQPGMYTWEIEYTGGLAGKIAGFYKSSYTVPGETEPRYLATTDFEPTDARQAFPCFDEPNIKTFFKIKLRHESKYIGLSNMIEEDRIDIGDGMVETVFGDPEVKMSTYLVCFIVCDFGSVEGKTKSNVTFRVFAPEHKIEEAYYALKVGINITEYFEEYFGLPYSLKKLDMIAIPDFSAGAMENWGLITYREQYLLIDNVTSSASYKQLVCVVVSHELAHQWFGNIVTMDWWDDLWLNEGFASYVEYLGADQAEPTWQMQEQFVVNDLYSVFRLDQIVSSHPIIIDVNRPEEISEVFDSISYSKGASVIRMLNDFMGEESFKEGLQRYLKKYEFGNAKSADLWEQLQSAYDDIVKGNLDIADIMDTWTKQMGFPVVNVEKDMNDLVLNQDWFLVDPNANRSAAPFESPYDYKWEIPFSSKFQMQLDDPPNYQWMERTDTDVVVTGDNSDWYIANYEEKGYYRVNYDIANWEALSLQLNTDHTMIPITDRSGLLDDAFNLAQAEQLDYVKVLDMTVYMDKEMEYIPWDAAYSNFMWLSDILRYQPAFADWRVYLQSKTKTLLNKYNDWSAEVSHLENFLRTDIIYLSCSSGDPDCLNEALTQFYKFLNNETVSANVLSPVLRFGMELDGGQDNWDALWERYVNSDTSAEKSRISFGLARTRHVWLLSRYIEYAMDESKIRRGDFFSVLSYISGNPVGNPLIWDYIRANWEYLVDRFGLSRSLGSLTYTTTQYYSTELKLQQMEEFFEKYPEAGAGPDHASRHWNA
ncbi:Glutamyl aminopeptidase [Apostichopus japonicus]|uniref:Aminopeptidase n=1 Tax=Stichopus japonicus TaxID=307972 RepID=A0A2G8JX36_STIJA|nr:Glutamyl aminopeptidase [Apostichopus japonicus]